MNILLTNDDGYQAAGLQLIYQYLKQHSHHVLVVAPDGQRSGFSQRITLFEPIKMQKIADDVIALSGTPADCVLYTLNGMVDFKPDLVISGINHGRNVGIDIIYSGTVAAARQAAMSGIPALALSYFSFENFFYDETVCRFLDDYFDKLVALAKNVSTFVNVNIPHVKNYQIKGVKMTKISAKMKYNDRIVCEETDGVVFAKLVSLTDISDAEPDSDAFELANDYVTVSLPYTFTQTANNIQI